MKLNIFLNGCYIGSSIKYKTCKELKNKILNDKKITVASVPAFKTYYIKENDNIKIKRSIKES